MCLQMKAPSWSNSMLQGKFLSPKPIFSFTIRSELMRIRESQLAISALVETQGQLLVEQMDRLNQLEERLNNTTTNNSNITLAHNPTSNSNSNISVAQNISTSSNSSQLIQNSTIVVSPSPTATASNSMASSSPSDNQASSTSAN